MGRPSGWAANMIAAATPAWILLSTDRRPARDSLRGSQRGAICSSMSAILCSVAGSLSPSLVERRIDSAIACTCAVLTGSGSDATAASRAIRISVIVSGGKDAFEKSFIPCQHSCACRPVAGYGKLLLQWNGPYRMIDPFVNARAFICWFHFFSSVRWYMGLPPWLYQLARTNKKACRDN